MWKLKNFSLNQILREINLEKVDFTKFWPKDCLTKRNFKLKVKYFPIWLLKFEHLFNEISESISRIFNLQIQNGKWFQHFIHLKTLASPLMASMTLLRQCTVLKFKNIFCLSNFYVKSIVVIIQSKDCLFNVFRFYIC